MFTVIEGLDGVGKTTLVNDLAQYCGGRAMSTPILDSRQALNAVLDSLGSHQIARCLVYAASVLVAGQQARKLSDMGERVFMDRYWLSTIAYARARGVSIDLSPLESAVPVPDLTVLVTLDERDRQQRLTNRLVTAEDRETFDSQFRKKVLREMRRPDREPGLRPTEIDLTDCDYSTALQRVLELIINKIGRQSDAG